MRRILVCSLISLSVLVGLSSCRNVKRRTKSDHVITDSYITLKIANGKSHASVHKSKGENIVFAFEKGNYDFIQGTLSSADPASNVRFTQIFMPDGSADGPFGKDIRYDLHQPGLYKISVGENMMAGDPWEGEFTIDITLRHYVQ